MSRETHSPSTSAIEAYVRRSGAYGPGIGNLIRVRSASLVLQWPRKFFPCISNRKGILLKTCWTDGPGLKMNNSSRKKHRKEPRRTCIVCSVLTLFRACAICLARRTICSVTGINGSYGATNTVCTADHLVQTDVIKMAYLPGWSKVAFAHTSRP